MESDYVTLCLEYNKPIHNHDRKHTALVFGGRKPAEWSVQQRFVLTVKVLVLLYMYCWPAANPRTLPMHPQTQEDGSLLHLIPCPPSMVLSNLLKGSLDTGLASLTFTLPPPPPPSLITHFSYFHTLPFTPFPSHTFTSLLVQFEALAAL